MKKYQNSNLDGDKQVDVTFIMKKKNRLQLFFFIIRNLYLTEVINGLLNDLKEKGEGSLSSFRFPFQRSSTIFGTINEFVYLNNFKIYLMLIWCQ